MNKDGCAVVVIVVGVLTALSMMINSCNNNGYAPTTTTTTTSNNSFEHRYVKERFKLEGYSDKESQQAADAIIKFNNAQKNRNK